MVFLKMNKALGETKIKKNQELIMNTNLKDTECSNEGNEWADEYDKWVEDILKEDKEYESRR